MPIKFYISGYNGERPDRASYRFRATIPLKSMRPEDGIISDVKQATKDDIVVGISTSGNSLNVKNGLITSRPNEDGQWIGLQINSGAPWESATHMQNALQSS